ncbi:MAG: hypothetical protein QOF53_3906 [Nocardioidaceae bacterium]|nr:hypothetical protein [Nocardioidaceae bacterium]
MRYATLWARCWCVIGAVGVGLSFLVWSPLSVLSVFLTAALCCGILLLLLSPTTSPQSARPSVSWTRIATRAAVAAAGIVAASASLAAVPYLALPLIGLAILSSPWVVEWFERWREADTRQQEYPRGVASLGPLGDGTPETGSLTVTPIHLTLEEMRAEARELSNSELCREWRRSFVRLQSARSFPDRCYVVALRQVYLDEMDRRCPTAFQAWLASGARAAGGPDRYLAVERHEGHSDAA